MSRPLLGRGVRAASPVSRSATVRSLWAPLALTTLLLLSCAASVVSATPFGAPSYACPPDFVTPHGPTTLSDSVKIVAEDMNTKQPVTTDYAPGQPMSLTVSCDVCHETTIYQFFNRLLLC